MSRDEQITLVLDKLSKLSANELRACLAWMKAVEMNEKNAANRVSGDARSESDAMDS